MLKKITILIAFALFLFIIYIIYDIAHTQNNPSSYAKNTSVVGKVKDILVPKQDSPLKQVLENKIKDFDGTYGIVVINLKTAETVEINSEYSFGTASLYKLWVMAEAYNQIKTGELKKTDVLAQTQETLDSLVATENNQKAATGEDENKTDENEEVVISSTVDDALEQMIIISDNNSALLLSARLTHQKISDFLKTYGFGNSSYGNLPLSTPADIAAYLDKLYKKQIVGEVESTEMLNLLSRQRLNDRIPKYLPQSAKVAHKTGELDSFKHDAGIVYGKNDYIIVVMTDTPRPAEAAENTAQISKTVWEYFDFKF